MYNLNYQEEAKAFKESISDLKNVLMRKSSNSHSLIKSLNESYHNKSVSEFNKENVSSVKIDKNKSSLSIGEFNDFERNHSSASRSPKKFNDSIININSLQIELD